MSHNSHDLQLSVLIHISIPKRRLRVQTQRTYLEPLILEHSLDCRIFSRRRQLCLEYNAKGTISDDFALRVLHLFRLTRQSILHFLANDFCLSRSVSIEEGSAVGDVLTAHAQACEARSSLRHAVFGRRTKIDGGLFGNATANTAGFDSESNGEERGKLE